MEFEKFSSIALPEIEANLQQMLIEYIPQNFPELREMLAYHMGWESLNDVKNRGGKRVRPLLVLLCTNAAGGDWRQALPASSAVEYIHNFSLIHDDIQDNSELRRGRKTVWVKWGVAQAINAGDLMFTIGHLALQHLREHQDPFIVMKASELLLQSCVFLTRGQYRDISYENRDDINLDDYWDMIGAKTAALLSCSAELGALIGRADKNLCDKFHSYGYSLGLAFQIQDDWLGIWGDSALTGKAIDSDLAAGKKTLPILFGLSKNGDFAKRWNKGAIPVDEAPLLAEMLINEGAQQYTEEMVKQETNKAKDFLDEAVGNLEAGQPLRELTQLLLERKK
jgi:geranylgeranyl diphosphate synthase, type I